MLLVLVSVMTANGQPQSDSTEKNVLVLYDEQIVMPGLETLDQSIRATLSSHTSAKVNIYNEWMDLSRFDESGYRLFLRDYYKQKYSRKKLDVVIAALGPSLDFALAHMEEIAPGTPIVFCGVDRSEMQQLSLRSNVTGVLVKRDFKGTLDVALKLQPDTRQVVFIAGTSTFDKDLLEQASQDLKPYEDRLKFSYLTDLPLSSILNEISQLPSDTIILYSTVFRDGAGSTYVPHEVISRVSQTANVPVYGFVDQYLGRGIVGGHLYSFEAHGSKAAELALRILRGERAADIPIVEAAASVDMFDARQLRRWKISEQSLPPGSVVNFRELTLWQLYKWRILGTLALIALQSLLIAFLLIERRRRQIAAEARRHLATIVESSDDAILSKTLDGRILSWNAGAELMYGYSANEMIGQPVSKLAPADKKGEVSDIIERIIGGEHVDHFETERVTKDGRQIYVSLTISAVQDEHGKITGASTIARDITKRKESEVALRQALDSVNELKNQLDAENIYLQSELQQQRSTEIVGESEAIKNVIFKINQVAPTDSTVLIMGETGTGKELVARAIHSGSSRSDRSLIKVNCAALSPTLIESELFGHEKGAFTGAGARRLGRFELANGSTLFLDEIGELPMELQAKLLRVIQEGELERVGAAKTIKVDVRIIAATNKNLKLEVDKGNFRQDLWYRLNVFPITVPPLNQRKDDIPLLVDYFVNTSAKKFGKAITSVSATTMRNLQLHSWPGNIRELANVIERAVINSSGSILKGVGLFEQQEGEQTTSSPTTLEEIEREHIVRTLERTGWRIEGPNGAAKLLDINASTLRTKMTKLQIRRPRASAV
ncbi:MAG TPA: sigma 54-interacting transcriptional regulator [Pyrinomonadaceae bacterium]|nr:sigma 54-interacting transcriptional regulator [Pyrinomonadaceae bacterium]